jgi:cytochrome P450
MATFFLCMALYPQVQRKAQEEIDRVVSTSRLPTFEDRENLPYVNALVKEALRWHPVTPMGAPHMATEDDIYEGYYIPKGATILWNAWCVEYHMLTYLHVKQHSILTRAPGLTRTIPIPTTIQWRSNLNVS